MIVVSDAGPLIALARIARLDLIPSLVGSAYIGTAVWHEIVKEENGIPGTRELAGAAWLKRKEVRDNVAVDLLRERLGAGESEAIVLAIELEANILLIDEARGRRVAEAQGLHAMGVLGFLTMAKRRGLLPAVAPLIDRLDRCGFRMSKALRQTVLDMAGEIL